MLHPSTACWPGPALIRGLRIVGVSGQLGDDTSGGDDDPHRYLTFYGTRKSHIGTVEVDGKNVALLTDPWVMLGREVGVGGRRG